MHTLEIMAADMPSAMLYHFFKRIIIGFLAQNNDLLLWAKPQYP